MSVWEAASPALKVGKEGWRNPQLAVLAHSTHDQEIDKGQPQAMLQALEDHPGGNRDERGPRLNRWIMLKGQHNEIWSEGKELARAIQEAVDMVSYFS